MSTALRERLSLIVGTVSAHKDGHGFLMPEDRSAPIYLAPRQMAETMHGDRAAVRVSGTDHRGRPEGVHRRSARTQYSRDRRPAV